MNPIRNRLYQAVKFGSCSMIAALAASQVPLAVAQDEQASLEEIVVTARFREENLQDVPASIRAFSGDDMAKLGINTLGDLTRMTPSLNVQERGPNRNELNIRGVTNFLTTQDLVTSARPVSIYIDEVPVNTPGGSQTDIRNYDLARVEILRGPQGTLYGEGSSAGAVRYFSNDPDFESFGGGLEIEGVYIDDGDNDFGLRGHLNIPFADGRAGLRLSGGRYVLPGYIDTPDKDDANAFEAVNLRAVLAAEFSDDFSGRLMVNYDDSEVDGLSLTTGDPEDRETNLPTSDDKVEDESLIVSLKLDYRFDSVTLSSITGYFDRDRERNTYDQIFSLVNSFVTIPTGGFSDRTRLQDSLTYEQFSQEFRLVSSLDGPFQYTAGVFYRDLTYEAGDNTTCSATYSLVGLPGECDDEIFAALGLEYTTPPLVNDGEQISVFFEGEYSFNEQWTLIAGLRYHDEEIDVSAPSNPVLLNLQPLVLPEISETVTIEALLPKVALEYTPTDDLMFFAQYATGARNGNINSNGTLGTMELFAPGSTEGLGSYDDDSVEAYELGLKSTQWDGRATFNASLFYTDYTDMQVLVAQPPLGFALIVNASEASSTGFEAEFSAALSDNLTLFAGGNYTKAELEEDLVTSVLTGEVRPSGTPLPNIPEWTANAGLEYTAPAFGTTDWYLNGSWAYTGEYATSLDARSLTLGDFSVFNAGLGLRSDAWSLDLLVTNLTDEAEVVAENNFDPVITNLGLPVPPGDTFNEIFILQPRTVRLAFRYNF